MIMWGSFTIVQFISDNQIHVGSSRIVAIPEEVTVSTVLDSIHGAPSTNPIIKLPLADVPSLKKMRSRCLSPPRLFFFHDLPAKISIHQHALPVADPGFAVPEGVVESYRFCQPYVQHNGHGLDQSLRHQSQPGGSGWCLEGQQCHGIVVNFTHGATKKCHLCHVSTSFRLFLPVWGCDVQKCVLQFFFRATSSSHCSDTS